MVHYHKTEALTCTARKKKGHKKVLLLHSCSRKRAVGAVVEEQAILVQSGFSHGTSLNIFSLALHTSCWKELQRLYISYQKV